MEKIELLAPAKNLESAIVAINCGADAVYIGANSFGARQSAVNSISDIEKLVQFAHLFNAKVYVTINTIINDNELEQVKDLICELYNIKVDAIIVQDFAILKMSQDNLIPPIVIHMSTQADIRDVEKVKFFEKINIKRVILARELSLDKIKKIKKETNIELECFVAGALCVGYSGICYFSQYNGSRSANRGSCAQPCRKKYSLIDSKGNYIVKNKHLLSLKDNNLSFYIDKLANLGIKSFKIEGRLKDINYIKNNVLYYNNLLSKYPRSSKGKIISDFSPNLFKTFNRGFSSDYLLNKKDNIYSFLTPKSIGQFIGEVTSLSDNFFTVKTKEIISAQDGLCYSVADDFLGCLVNKADKIKEGYKIFPNKKHNLKKGTKIYRNLDVEFNKILENSKTSRKLEVDFIVEEDKISLYDENNNKVSYIICEFEFANNIVKMKDSYSKSLTKTNDTPFLVRKVEFKADNLRFIPVSKLNEIRRHMLNDLKEKILQKYKVKKQKPIDIAQFPLEYADYRLNIFNEKSKEFYEFCGVSDIEYALEKTNDYKSKELMRTKHCLKRATLGCKDETELFLKDEKDVIYPLKFDCKNCEMAIIAPK